MHLLTSTSQILLTHYRLVCHSRMVNLSSFILLNGISKNICFISYCLPASIPLSLFLSFFLPSFISLFFFLWCTMSSWFFHLWEFVRYILCFYQWLPLYKIQNLHTGLQTSPRLRVLPVVHRCNLRP